MSMSLRVSFTLIKHITNVIVKNPEVNIDRLIQKQQQQEGDWKQQVQ